MPMYTFYVWRADGVTDMFEAFEVPNDSAAYARAGQLLTEHESCDYIDVFEDERPVVARHREPPIIRPIEIRSEPVGGAASNRRAPGQASTFHSCESLVGGSPGCSGAGPGQNPQPGPS